MLTKQARELERQHQVVTYAQPAMTAQQLIETKEILTNEERETVLAFNPEWDRKYLFNLGQRGWLNSNVYSEAEHQDLQFRMEVGI